MKKWQKNLLIIILVAVILGWILNAIFALVGNPLTSAFVKKAASEYVEDNYQELNLQFVELNYDYKFDHYEVVYKNQEKEEIILYVYVNGKAEVLRDYLKSE